VNRKKADELSKLFSLDVLQSRYSDWGNFYGLVQFYPCALWDRSGYIIFANEHELKIPEISVSKRINIPRDITLSPNLLTKTSNCNFAIEINYAPTKSSLPKL
jgi:hypothetical protein